ncbi:hypothetical protein FYJ61_06305 [Lactobacillus equicursoris]|uniref:Uncharacterized protein n=1 Tax=Lactobacillus equicursoris TaxID=420645 RepID=A0A844FPA7_9LACO|nr:hypothetical protein [Lactobacillus equicursoris]MST80073.1 hypothetical protein [Lactobacillus equicursoris]
MNKNRITTLMALPLLLCFSANTVKANTFSTSTASLTNQQIKKINDEQQGIANELKERLSGLSESDVKADADATTTEIIKSKYTQLESAVSNNKLQNTNPNKLEKINNSYEITPNVTISFEGSAVLVDVHDETESSTNDLIETSSLRASTVSSTRASRVNALSNQLSPMISLTAASGTRTKNASNTVTCHDYFIKKWVLVTAHIAATFNYNPSKGTCTARRTSNYMKLGSFTPVLSVINTHSAVQKPSKSRRIAYQDGTISGKVTVFGASLGKENYLRVNVECNSHGTIKKSHLFK